MNYQLDNKVVHKSKNMLEISHLWADFKKYINDVLYDICNEIPRFHQDCFG